MIWTLMIGILVLDQLTKYYVSNTFEYLESIPIIQDVFHLTYVHNHGAAFGILQNQRIFFIVISVIVIGLFLYFYRQLPHDWMTRLAVGLALGGTIGNLIDRIRVGYVVDFFDFQIWPIFNIADSAIVVGMILLARQVLFTDFDSKIKLQDQDGNTGEMKDE